MAAPDRSQHVLAHVPQPVSSNVFPRIRLGTTTVKSVLILAWTSAQAAAQAPRADGKKTKPEFDKDDESSSKHKKKKGLAKLNPF